MIYLIIKNKKNTNKMKNIREKSKKLSIIFSIIWAINLLYGEMFAFWVPVFWTCSWPHLHSSSSLMSKGRSQNDYVKVAVVTDPQLMDRTSLPLAPKSLALEIVQFYTDLYMRRAFLSSIMPFEPDAILFLGDYFDGGPMLSNEDWQESLSRFKHIFDVGKKGRTKDVPVYYLSGNHDIGYAWHANHKPEVIERYESQFGRRNYRFSIGEVDFVAIDSQTVDGTADDIQTTRTWDFVKNLTTDVGARSRVLLTHMPLYRPDWTSCGPHRSSEIINQRILRSPYDQRIRYQNYVSDKSSSRLLDLVKPGLVLSGHDHDQCTVTHKTEYGSAKEHTVGTISWQQGNWYPSFMLLSVRNFTLTDKSSSDPEILVRLCFLPIQLFIYMWYIALFVITILALSFWPSQGIDIGHHCGRFMTNIKKLVLEGIFAKGSKEKNEDEECEYEMVWDAEGGMHLVKKPRSSSVASKETMNATERGNAVMRPAKRQTLAPPETAAKVDSGVDLGSSTAVMLQRSSKSTMIIRRCVRVLGMVSVIALMNVPLYVMLLFKDWVE
ncbi:hypothetical protein RND81_05G239200 [Saponaria officinalis]|uniref:Calcineurin-like phosphoesterase domain-containing protein n=1 Tax=Saponaria officinalis TaxID=3572 RepID=A0AAW1L2N5_SAPOF